MLVTVQGTSQTFSYQETLDHIALKFPQATLAEGSAEGDFSFHIDAGPPPGTDHIDLVVELENMGYDVGYNPEPSVPPNIEEHAERWREHKQSIGWKPQASVSKNLEDVRRQLRERNQ